MLTLSLMRPEDHLVVAHVYNNAKTDLTYNYRPEYIKDTYEAYLFTRVRCSLGKGRSRADDTSSCGSTCGRA